MKFEIASMVEYPKTMTKITRSAHIALIVLFLCSLAHGQTPPFSLLPVPRMCFINQSGVPDSGGFVATFAAGTSTPLATYTDYTGLYQNTNPVTLDSLGCATIYIGPQSYKIVLQDSTATQIWAQDNVSDPGQLLYAQVVLLNPVGAALQTIVGPLAASYFQGTTAHMTSPGVRVSLLDPLTTIDTVTNPPIVATTTPGHSGQTYQVPDPTTPSSNFVLSPGPPDWVASTAYVVNTVIQPLLNNPCNFQFNVTTAGTSNSLEPTFSTTPCVSSATTVSDGTVVWTSLGLVVPTNTLDCTRSGINCKRTAYFYMEGGGCNNTTAALGWDSYGTNAPVPRCITGTNIQKGAMSLPGAMTKVQENTGSGAAATTCTTTYPAATTGGDLLEVEIVVDGSHTVSSVTDGTNAYSKAVSIGNGTTDLEIWYFANTSTTKAAATTLTVTLSASSNCALDWKEYSGVATGDSKDVTASNTGTGVAVGTGSTAGTAQNVELVLAAVGTPFNATITPASGTVQHSISSQGSNISVVSSGRVQQLTAPQSSTFLLGTSAAWASAIVTFKANVGNTISAQRTIGLPSYFISSVPINAAMKWSGSSTPTGVIDTVLGAALVCVADGNTDDVAFLAPTTATVPVSQTGPVLTTTLLSGLTSTGCGPGQTLHVQAQRLRYNASDTYEGYVDVTGVGVTFGINQ